MNLGWTILRRVLVAIPMVLVLGSIIFFVTNVLPGDPARVIVGPMAPEEHVIEVRKILGLDSAMHIQYIEFMTALLRLDLGKSFMTRRPVMVEILERFPLTFELAVLSMAIGVSLGIIVGIFSAHKQGKLVDHIVRVICVLLYCIPIYILGGVAQLELGVRYGLLPISGRISGGVALTRITGLYILDSILTANFIALVDVLRHFVLPTLLLGGLIFTIICRMSRVNMIDTLQKNYITMVRTTGLPERVILLKHALKNAILPVITMGSLHFALLLGGAVLTESVFSLPGLGRLLVLAATSRDLPLIRGIVVFYAVVITVVNMVTDVIYYLIDPRISVGA